MFPRLTPSRLGAVLILGAALAAGLWFLTRPDPRTVFLDEVETLLSLANTREYPALLKKLSPEAEQRIREEFMPPAAALRWLGQTDINQNRAYRFVILTVFHARDYAEVEIERSAPGQDFDGRGTFSVPFLWRDGRWWVAGGFRGDRDWNFPE